MATVAVLLILCAKLGAGRRLRTLRVLGARLRVLGGCSRVAVAEVPSSILAGHCLVPTAWDLAGLSWGWTRGGLVTLGHLVLRVRSWGSQCPAAAALGCHWCHLLVAHGTSVLHVEPLAQAGGVEEVAAGGDHCHLHVLWAGTGCHPVCRGPRGVGG